MQNQESTKQGYDVYKGSTSKDSTVVEICAGRDKERLDWQVTKHRMMMVLILVSSGGLMNSLAQATDFFVDRRNSQCDDAGEGTLMFPFCSISAAALVTESGDKVTVKPGIYEEVVDINESGEPGETIRFIGAAEADDPVVVSGGRYGFDVAGEEEISIEGFTIMNTQSHGIRASFSHDISISNNQIIDTEGNGISLSSADQVEVRNNHIESTFEYGIYVGSSSEVVLHGNYVTRSGRPALNLTRKGIYISASSHVLVEHNTLDSNSDAGIYLVNGSSANLIRKNISFNNRREYTRAAPGYEIKYSLNNTLEANIGYNNEDSGINVTGLGGEDSNNLLVNNVCYLNGDHGIDIRDQPGVSIIGNTVYRNVTSGINVEGYRGSTNTTIINNISVDNAIDSPRKDGNINVDRYAVSGTVADFNLVYLTDPYEPHDEYEMYVWDDEDYLSLQGLQAETTGVEENGLEADPLWEDVIAADFHLMPGSPAIDSANSGVDGALPVDFDGNERYDDPYTINLGLGPREYDDRGAYELQVGAPPPPPPPPPVTVSFRPEADSWVNLQRPNQNYGDDTELVIDSQPEQLAYLRFTVRGIEGEVISARLRLEVTNPTWSGGMIFATETNWDEAAMTYNSGRPELIGDAIDTIGRINVGQLVEADVTPWISGDGIYSFAILPTNPDKAAYLSREGSSGTPLLIIEQIIH